MISHRLDIRTIEKASQIIDPVFLHSPQFLHEPLSDLLGCKILLKVETINPIRCFKGRGADFLISQSNEKELICASAGNFGQAMAYACRKANKKLTVYASTKANPLKIERMQSLGAEVILGGEDFDAAKSIAKQVTQEKNLRFVEDGLDIETLAGAGSIGLELTKQFSNIDAILIPLGNGALLNGVARVFKEKSPSTKVIAIQATGAPAMVESWKENKLISHSHIHTIADGIGVRIPIAQALEDMKGLVDDGMLVSEDAIIEAMKLLHLHAGLVVEPSGAVGLAVILENKKKFEGKTVATVICGSNLTEEQIKKWLA
jgi:threonine dehydratase